LTEWWHAHTFSNLWEHLMLQVNILTLTLSPHYVLVLSLTPIARPAGMRAGSNMVATVAKLRQCHHLVTVITCWVIHDA
jgi:hypothetical protein